MTVYQCSICGGTHTSDDPPCTQTIELPSQLYALSRIDRFYIVCALKARHKEPGQDVAKLIAALAPTPAELEADKAYVEEQRRYWREKHGA